MAQQKKAVKKAQPKKAASAKKEVKRVSRVKALWDQITEGRGAMAGPVQVRWFDKFTGHTMQGSMPVGGDWRTVIDKDRIDLGHGVYTIDTSKGEAAWTRVDV